MYCHFFGFRIDPFTSTAPASQDWLSDNCRLLAKQLNGEIENKTGVSMLYGPAGVGKSTLVHQLIEKRQSKNYNVTIKDLSSYGELSVFEPDQAMVILDALSNDGSFVSHTEQPKAVFLLDHADSLSNDFIEQLLTVVSDRNTADKPTLLILVGLLRLKTRLESGPFEAYRTLLGNPLIFERLSFKDVENYIHLRLKFAEYSGPTLFSGGAIQRIFKLSKGILRVINTLCGSSLLLASFDKQRIITEETVNNAAEFCFLEKETSTTDKPANLTGTTPATMQLSGKSLQPPQTGAQSLRQIIQMLNEPEPTNDPFKPAPINLPEPCLNQTANLTAAKETTGKITPSISHRECSLENRECSLENGSLSADSPILPIKSDADQTTTTPFKTILPSKSAADLTNAGPDSDDNPNKFQHRAGLAAAAALLFVASLIWVSQLLFTDPENNNIAATVETPVTKPVQKASISPFLRESSSTSNPVTAPSTEVNADGLAHAESIETPIAELVSMAQPGKKELPVQPQGNNADEPYQRLVKLDLGNADTTRRIRQIKQQLPESSKQSKHRVHRRADPSLQNTQTLPHYALPSDKSFAVRHRPEQSARQGEIKTDAQKQTSGGDPHPLDRLELAAKTRASARYQLAQKGIPYNRSFES